MNVIIIFFPKILSSNILESWWEKIVMLGELISPAEFFIDILLPPGSRTSVYSKNESEILLTIDGLQNICNYTYRWD